LPQPDGPSNAKNEPAGIVSVKLSTALKSPNDLVRLTKCKSSTLGRLFTTRFSYRSVLPKFRYIWQIVRS